MTLGQGQEMTLTLNTHFHLLNCLYLPTFRSQAKIVPEKSTVFTFPIEKPVTKFDLAVKQVKVTPGSSFEQTMMGRSPQCYIPSFMEIGRRFQRSRFLKGFYHIWAWQPSLSCEPDAAYKILFPLPKEASYIIFVLSQTEVTREQRGKIS